ncbi:hypothetical protein BH09BAC4_BH09BAC4_07400 [soil metagenome]
MLTTDQIRLVKQTWITFRQVDPALLGEVFYAKLFMEHPALRPLFTTPLDQQYKKLVEMMNVLIARLDRPAEVMPSVEQLGVRHRGYGVKPEHYAQLENSLLWTLQTGLGYRWNEEVKAAWTSLYQVVATTMINAQ